MARAPGEAASSTPSAARAASTIAVKVVSAMAVEARFSDPSGPLYQIITRESVMRYDTTDAFIDDTELRVLHKKVKHPLYGQFFVHSSADAIDAGPADNAIVVEGLTSVLLAINKRHKVKGAGIRITGT